MDRECVEITEAMIEAGDQALLSMADDSLSNFSRSAREEILKEVYREMYRSSQNKIDTEQRKIHQRS
jgi:hypothetical protein